MKAKLLITLVTLAAAMLTAPAASAQQATANKDPFSSPAEDAPSIRSFSAVLKNDKVYLNWTATDRSGECLYIIERSIDGSSFQKMNVKKGAPSPGSEALLFSFIDEQPVNGNVIYRVQQINNNGNSQAATAQVTNGNGNKKETNLAWRK